MRLPLKSPKIVIGAIMVLGFSMVTLSLTRTVLADSQSSKSGERLVVIHDGEIEQGIITKATTVREAIEEAKVSLDANDMVEPKLDETLVATSYDINIYRARPIVIIDGAIRKKIMSAYRTPAQIVEHAGMELRSEDVASMDLPMIAVGSGAAIELTITRATPVNFVLYGKKMVAYTRAKTVRAMLQEKGVSLGESDGMSIDGATSIVADMTVEVWREGKQTVTAEEEVSFKTEKIQDIDREVGFHEVVTPGITGKRSVTYEIEIRNGVEVGRHEIQSVVITEAKPQVERIGMKVNLPPGSHEDWMAAAGINSADYGYVNYIIGRESGWGVTKSNYAGSGAYGLCQALPGSKMKSAGDDWATNPITQLRWCNGYAVGRYGSWAKAYEFWINNHWW